jgi:hypothetical protein
MNTRALTLFLLLPALAFAQPKIHAHNDYAQPRPFWNAYEQRVDYIEADVYLRDDKLLVAHAPNEINSAKTLDSLYLAPISALFLKHTGRPSPDRRYTFSLMIDAKDDAAKVLPALISAIEKNIIAFNRPANPLAVQVIVSGNRPRVENYLDFPLFISFDGRPNEVYDEETIKRVAVISDSFRSYSRWDGTGELPEADRDKLKRIIKRAHNYNKPIRFWAIPDTENAWKQLRKLGVDIINTDNVNEAAKVLR